MKTLVPAITAVSIALAATAAQAGKSNDTLNVALSNPMEGVSPIYASSDEAQLYTRVVFDRLIAVDFENRKFVPWLAKSWRKVDPTTWEFSLRDDLKFHDGSVLNADDVVYTLNWVADPKVHFRAKNRFSWIKNVEKIDDLTVRLHTKRPYALALMRLAVSAPIFPSDIHGALKDKVTFAYHPVGSGPYKATMVDKNKGVTLVINDYYPQASKVRPKGKIGTMNGIPIPDEQTQVAEMLTGRVDLIRAITREVAHNLSADPRYKQTVVNGLQYNYFYLDAAGRSGANMMKDLRVREAIAHAIDRKTIRESIIPGGATAFPLDALCVPFQVGCDSTTKPLAYDPQLAKKLLAEAGYPNGFSFKSYTLNRSRPIAEAIGGYLYKVGVNMSIEEVTFTSYRKAQADGKMTGLIHIYGSGGIPDTGVLLNFHFNNKTRDYAKDAKLNKLIKEADTELDTAKRDTLIREALDRNNRQVYVIPLGGAPQVFVHTTDLAIPPVTINGYGALLDTLDWK